MAQLRASIPNARVWPFETGAALPSATEARVVFAEVYPSLFNSSKGGSPDVHDKLQVVATAVAFAERDSNGTLPALFAAPDLDARCLGEEGWIFGLE